MLPRVIQKPKLRVVPPHRNTPVSNNERPVTLPPAARDYYRRIEDYAERIRQTRDVPQIVAILDEAMRETQKLATQNGLQLAQDRIEQAEREIAELKAELEDAVVLVQVDQLTQVLNRRGLYEAFSRESARSDRHGAPLCVAIIDMDNFKSVNDTWGHAIGDNALVMLASTLRTTLRPVDVVARFGGEEFVILLPESDGPAALAALSRVQHRLIDNAVANGLPPLTFSAGIALRSHGEVRELVLQRADNALLEAKRTGKNRVLLAQREIAST